MPTKWSSWRDTLTGPLASVWQTWPRPWWRTWTGSTLSPPWWRWEEFTPFIMTVIHFHIPELHRINQGDFVKWSLHVLLLVCRACMESVRRCTWVCPVCLTAAEWAASSTWPLPTKKSLSWRRAVTLCGASKKTWRTCRSTVGCHTLVHSSHSLSIFTHSF